MPQIDNVLAFIKFCRSRGVRYRKVLLTADNLKPRQNDINLSIVFAIIQKGLNTRDYPLLIAKDKEILDGHHRWYAGKIQYMKVECYHLRASERELLELAILFGAQHRKINANEKITK